MQNDNGEDVPYLYEKELKIVGTVQSPMYISVDRGTSTFRLWENRLLYVYSKKVMYKQIVYILIFM